MRHPNERMVKASPNCALTKTKRQRLCGKKQRDDRNANLKTTNQVKTFSFRSEELNDRDVDLKQKRASKERDKIDLRWSDGDVDRFQSPVEVKKKRKP